MPHQIIVNIDASGEVKVEAKGVKGAGCEAVTKAIEAALGQTSGDVKTGEFYQSQVTNAEQANAVNRR